MITGIQLDYGGFDPTFLGVTIRFGARTAWEAFDAFVQNTEPVSFSHLADDPRFEALATVSVLSHEIRHFHDFLLSPYSARIFRIRIQSLINLLGLLPRLLDKSSNCLFVPISKWCRLDSSSRARQVAQLKLLAGGRPWMPVPLPVLSGTTSQEVLSGSGLVSWGESPEKLIQAAILLQDRLADLTYNPRTVAEGKSFQPWQLFELSGLLVQIQDIYHTYGPAETEFFIRRLARAGKNPYSAMLSLASAMWDVLQQPFDTRLTSAVVFWTLMGSYEKDRWTACPTERFVRLWDLISHEGIRAGTDDLMVLLDGWSHRLRLSCVEEGLGETETLLGRFAEKVEQLLSAHKSTFVSEEFGDLLVQIARGLQKASDHMTRAFNRDPWAYVAPEQYLDNVPNFVNPVLRFCFDGSALHSPLTPDELKREGYVVQWALESENGTDLLSFIKPFKVSEFVFFNSSEVDRVHTHFGLVDFLFAERARARADIQRPGRAFFRESHILPIELLL